MVMKILGNTTSHKTTASMEWGRNHESIAFELYKQNKLSANSDVVVTKSGLWISPEHSFLGASPDAAIYDPSEKEPYGFAEIKCPYKHRSSSLSVAFVADLPWLMVNSKWRSKRNICIIHKSKDRWQLDISHGVTLYCTY